MNPSYESTESELRTQLDECRAELSRLRLLLDVQATIDLPTGLFNASGMLEPIQGAMDRLARMEEPFAVVVIDLPEVAARHGSVRDDALRHAGAVVTATVRGLDRVGRIGDGALMLVLPQLGAAGVQVVLERLDRALGVVPMPDGDDIALEAAFTALLSPATPVEPELLLDAMTDAREQASPGKPAIVTLGSA